MPRKGWIEMDGKDFLVGAKDHSDKESPYDGPTARISYDDMWLNICTNSYEGDAMLNIEALPYLRLALAKIAKERKAKQRADAKSG